MHRVAGGSLTARAYDRDHLHAYFIDRLVPVCSGLLDAAAAAGEIVPGMHAYELLRGVGNLCIARAQIPATTHVA